MRLKSVVTAGSYQLAKAFVSQGMGVCIADEVTARSGCQEGVTIRELEPALEFRIAAMHKDQDSSSQVCRDFIEHLKHRLGHFLESSKHLQS